MNLKITQNKKINWLLAVVFLIMASPVLTTAQVDVTSSGGTPTASYLTLKASFDAINAGTHTGAISINITASTTETATASLDASGAGSTNYSAITISTTGGPWTIGGAIVAGSPLINFNGADNVTVNGGNNLIFSNTTVSSTSGTSTLKLVADATNNTFNNLTFLGSGNMSLATNGGIVFISTGTTTGNDNNSFQSCKFTAAGGNFPSKAIYANGSTSSASIANANININNCEIYDYFLAGGCAGIYALTGNTNWNITNNILYQTSSRAMTSTMNGIYFSNTTYGNNVQITGNTIGYANSAGTGTLTVTGTGSFQGIYFAGLSSAANVCNINNNIVSDISLTSSTGTFNGIVNASSASSNTINIISNRVKNIALLTTTGTAYGISWGSATSMDVTYNNVYNITRNGAGTTYGIASGASSTNENISYNTVYDLLSSAAAASTINGIYQNTASGTKLFQNNNVYNLSGQGGTSINGIFVGYGTTASIFENTIYNITNTGGTSGTIYGIQRGSTATTIEIYKNKIYGLSSTSTGPTLSGIYVAGGTTTKIYNNLIGDLTTSAANVSLPLTGINIGGGTTANVYYNTVLLNATSSGALFGSAAIYANTTPNLDLRNNILVNNSIPNGAGISSAYRRSSTTLTSYASTSNNNLFYAGTPSATTAIFYDGTNTYQTLAAYKTAMATRDQSSITENPTFFSTTGSSFNFLHINNFVATAIESGAANISGITDDFNAEIRQGNAGYSGTGTAPDIGADEFEGTSPTPIINSVSITPTGNQCTAVSRNITANVTPGSAPITSVTLNYSFNGVVQTPIVMTSGSFTTTSTWNATIPVSAPTNANVTWYVEVTDGTYTKSTSGTSYADEPASNFIATASASPNPVCIGNNATLTFSLQGTANTATYCTIAAATSTASYFNGFSTTGGIDNITNNSSGFSPNGYGNFTNLKVSQQQGQTVNFNTNLVGTTVGVAIWVDWNHNGTFEASERVYNTTGYVSTSSGSFTVPATAQLGTTTMRILMDFNVANPASPCGPFGSGRGEVEDYTFLVLPTSMNYSWTDGVSTFTSSTNTATFTVNSTSTFTGTTLINGCPLSATVLVNGTPIPSAPVAANSSQCGVGVPTASVSGGTNYNWYASPTSTTVLQSGSASNYTTSIGVTTTWYVTSVSGLCESTSRTAVTTTVSIPDGVTANTSSSNLCVGGANTITLTATQTGTTNPYTFSWDASPAAGSGMPTTMSGGTVVIVPTAVGMYSYSVTATDGICTTVATVTVALNNLPNISNAAATPSAICSGSTFSLTAGSIISGPQIVPTGYCTPTSSGSGCLTLVSLNTLTRASACETGFYINVPSSTTTNLTPGQTYTLSLTTDASAITSVWFDWNRDGIFTASEWVQPFTTGTSGSVAVLVPMSASPGLTKMRVRSRLSGNANGSGDACTSFGSGEAEDYTVNIQTDISSNYTWTWNPGTLSGNNVTTTATNTTGIAATNVYTVTATSTVTGCSNTATASIVINPIPATPVATDATQCGAGVPTASISGGTSYLWYASPTSTTVLQSGASSNYTSSINTTTTWYISSSNGSCESPRVALTQTVLTAPALSVTTPTGVVCANSITTLSITSVVSDYNNYIWSPNSNLYTDAAATVPYTGGSASILYFYSAVTGTSPYVISANNTVSGCVNTTSLTINTDMPSIIASATPTLLCSGSTVSLTANTNIIASGTSAIGTGTLVTSGSNVSGGSYISPFSHYFGGYKSQYIIRASELQSTGLTAGNITALSLNISSAGTTYTNFAISMAATSQSVATTTFNGSVSQVYGPSNVTPVVGINTYAFTTPYNWDGVSNIVIQICWSNNNTGGGGAAEVVYSPTSYASTSYYRVDSQTSSFVCGQTTATGIISNRPNIILAGQKNSTGAGSISWQWNPGAINSNTTTVMPVNTGTTNSVESYTVTALDPATTCTNSAVVSLTVKPLPVVMASASSPSVCAGSSATLTASGATNYTWTPGGINTATETVTVNSSSVYTLTGETNGCLNSTTVSIGSIANPTVIATASSATVCAGSNATLTASGATNYTWTSGGNTNTEVVTPVSMSVYTVSGEANGCSSTATVSVNAIANPTVMITASGSSVCSGASATLTAIGATNYTWTNGGNTNTEIVTPSSASVYTVTGEDSGCSTTATVSIGVSATPTVIAMTSNSIVCAGSPATLTASGATNYTWTSGGNTNTEVVMPTSASVYTVTGEDGGCSATATVSVDVTQLPTVTATASQTLLCDDGSTGSSILTASSTATSFLWSNGAMTMTTAVTPTTTTVYTVTATEAGCSADAFVTVTVSNCNGFKTSVVNGISIYPNPTNGIVNISISSELIGNTTVEVYDAIGKLVIKDNLSNDTNTISLSQLEDGMYLFKIINNNKAIKIGKVVKQ